MFDIGFSEILMIAGLSLVVLGPKKLPGVVRTMGRWAGRARAMARQFRDQLEAEADNFKVDLNSQATPGTAPPASAGAGPAAAAAAAAAPTPPPEFTGAPVEAAAAPAPAPPVVETPEFPSANDSGHADLGAADVEPATPAVAATDPAADPAAGPAADPAAASPAQRRA